MEVTFQSKAGFKKSYTTQQILVIAESTAAKESTDKERQDTSLLIISTPGSQEFAEHKKLVRL